MRTESQRHACRFAGIRVEVSWLGDDREDPNLPARTAFDLDRSDDQVGSGVGQLAEVSEVLEAEVAGPVYDAVDREAGGVAGSTLPVSTPIPAMRLEPAKALSRSVAGSNPPSDV